MKKGILFFALIISFNNVYSQRIITLQQCYDSAAAVTSMAHEVPLYSELSALNDRNLALSYMPSLDFSGSYMYNSDVVDMTAMFSALSVPEGLLPSIPHDQYKATLEINQLIWDGGVTRSARAVGKVVRELNMTQNEADIYRLREQVNNYYFSVLLASKQVEVTALVLEQLDARISDTRSAVANGILPGMALDLLLAEKIKVNQSLTEIGYRHNALLKALGMITGMGNLDDAALILPQQERLSDTIVYNPDFMLLDVRIRQLEAGKDLYRKQRMPRAFGFAQLGYGNPPGSNFLSDSPDMFYSLGVGIKWNIFDWNRNSNERKTLTIQQELLTIKKSAAEEALERVLAVSRAEIESLREASASDETLVSLRKKITAAAASQLNNGTITATEYLTELNNEKQAVLNAAIRLISISRAETEYMNLTGSK